MPAGLSALLALTGCGPQNGGGPEGEVTIPCVIGQDASWSDDCLVHREKGVLTVRHPDGGFRRFLIVRDGRGLVTADGAEQGNMQAAGKNQIELSVGQERYRFPVRFAQGVAR